MSGGTLEVWFPEAPHLPWQHCRCRTSADYGPQIRPSRKCRRISPGIVPSTSIGHLTMQVYPQCPVRPVAAGVVRYNGLCQAGPEWRQQPSSNASDRIRLQRDPSFPARYAWARNSILNTQGVANALAPAVVMDSVVGVALLGTTDRTASAPGGVRGPAGF